MCSRSKSDENTKTVVVELRYRYLRIQRRNAINSLFHYQNTKTLLSSLKHYLRIIKKLSSFILLSTYEDAMKIAANHHSCDGLIFRSMTQVFCGYHSIYGMMVIATQRMLKVATYMIYLYITSDSAGVSGPPLQLILVFD